MLWLRWGYGCAKTSAKLKKVVGLWKGRLMQRRYMQCDVFSDVPLKGNGLAVVLDGGGLSDRQMQAFASWTQQAETTFVMPPTVEGADYAVRIFSTTREMAFAGHPTLGSCAAWLQSGERPRNAGVVVQECAIGLVEVDVRGPDLAFVAPATDVQPMDPREQNRICAALGIAARDVLGAVTLDNGVMRQLIELPDAARVLALDASAVGLPLFQGVSVVGQHEAGGDAQYEVRNLCPASMGLEDAVTGSLIAAVGVWLHGKGRMGEGVVMAQGTAMGRAGRAFLRSRGDDVLVGGHVTVIIEGHVSL